MHENRTNRGPDDGINVVWQGGRIDWLTPKETKHLIAEIDAGRNPPKPPKGGWASDVLLPTTQAGRTPSTPTTDKADDGL